MNDAPPIEALLQENQQLRAKLEELEETLRAIRSGDVDALVVSRPEGEQIFTLKGALEPYRIMVENMSEGAVTLAQDGIISYSNGQFADLVKTPLDQVIGHPLQQWVAPHDRDKFGAMLARGWNETIRDELSMQVGEGKWLPVHLSMCPLPESAGKGIAAVITNLTDVGAAAEARARQRESEDKFRYVFEHSPIGKSITSPSGEIHVNKSFCDMLGYSEEELQHRKWQELTHPDDILPTEKAIEPLLAGRQESARFIKRYLHKNGSVVWADVSTSLRRDDTGNPLYFMTSVMDITERKRAEDALLQAHERLRWFVDSNIVGVVTATAAGGVLEANDYYLRLIGYSREEFEQGKVNWRAITPPEWLPVDEKALRELQERGVCTPYEKEYVRRDGSRVSVFLTDTLLPGPEAHIAAFVLDVTERKRAEEALRLSEERFRVVFESTTDSVLVWDADYNYLFANEAAIKHVSTTRDRVIGKNIRDGLGHIPEFMKLWMGRIDQAIANGQAAHFEDWSLVGENEVWSESTISPLRDNKGKPYAVAVVYRDITERKLAEEALKAASHYTRSLIEASLDPLVTISPEGKITDVNDATIVATGIPRQELVGSDFSQYFTEPDKARAGYREVFEKGYVTNYPLALRHVTGKVMEVLYNASVYRNVKGDIAGVFAAARDVTERKRAEEELRNYHEHLEELVRERTSQLEAANKDLEGFAYSVSHDLRVPLRAIDGFSNILLKRYPDKLDDEGKRYLNVVHDNTKRMAQLIDDILAFSRMGRLGMTISEIDMDGMVRAVLEELKPTLAGRDLAMEIGPLPSARGDSAMLHQTWINLLSNAIKFTRSVQKARITIGGRIEGNECVYYVRDNGIGFDMQYADQLFGVFQRLHGIEEFEGTGIGLAIVKRITTRHGGKVWAEGKVNEGATFYFSLPIEERSKV